MALLRIKVSFEGNTRRIVMKRDELSFENVLASLRKTFVSASFPNVSMTYRDEDEDFITITTDAELTDAVPTDTDVFRFELSARVPPAVTPASRCGKPSALSGEVGVASVPRPLVPDRQVRGQKRKLGNRYDVFSDMETEESAGASSKDVTKHPLLERVDVSEGTSEISDGEGDEEWVPGASEGRELGITNGNELFGCRGSGNRVKKECFNSVAAMRNGTAQIGRGSRRAVTTLTVRGMCTANCEAFIEKLKPQLAFAVRSKSEEAHRLKSTKHPAKTCYNYTRLKEGVSRLAFDAAGNWMVHEKCCRTALGVSSNWMASTHACAVNLRQMATYFVTLSTLNSMPEAGRKRAIVRILRPADCVVSVEKYLRSLDSSARINLVKEITHLHGLTGRSSNAAKTAERDAFRDYVKLNRSPTGRTIDKTGRTHGARYYMDSKWTTLVPAGSEEFPDDRPSLFHSFLLALESKALRPVSYRSVQRWMEIDFGSTRLENGLPVPSPYHASIFPHSKDACNLCAGMDVDEAHYLSALKKHSLQQDQGSMARISAIDDERAALIDLQTERKRHREEASAAMDYHKECVESAADIYKEKVDAYKQFLAKGKDVTQKYMERMADVAMDLRFDLSTDYQQDKGIPCWNRSAQPGATYFMSNVTHYLHILCLHFCGHESGFSRFSRNMVYSRSEEVSGAKTSDDTLSTVADALLGAKAPRFPQPAMFRSGYDKDGIVKKY